MTATQRSILERLHIQRTHSYILAHVKAINGAIAAAGDLGVCTGQPDALAIQWAFLEAAIKALENAVELATGHPDLELGWKDTLDALASDLDAFVDALPALEPQVPRPGAEEDPRTH